MVETDCAPEQRTRPVNGNDAVIVDGLRSPRGRGKSTGGLAHLHPQTLLAGVLNALADRVGFDPAAVEDVIIGNASGSDDHGSCIGRLAVLDAGWPYTVPGTVVNRYCGSGQQAVTMAATSIMAGQQDLLVAGGVESMSRLATGAAGLHAGNEHLFEVYPLVPQGISADLLATLHSFDRTRLDALALRSQQRAAVAIEDGRFAHSVVAVHNPDGSVALDADELPRPTTTADTLAALAPSFAKLGAMVLPEFGSKTFDELALSAYPELDHVEHVHHPGNSSGVADGASAILLASRTRANELGLRPRARIVQTAVAGSEPVVMLSGPPEAARICLAKAGMSVSDIDVWEVNEAFAAVLAHTIVALDLDESRVNVNGGAMALGHPIGATGPMLIQTALDELERSDRSAALVTMCTGGGMATATIIERA
jgi:acetyl-CoA C-acetyltransferase